MLAADKKLLLNGFFGELPPQMATRLVKAVEVDRLIGGTGLAHGRHPEGFAPAPAPARSAQSNAEARRCAISVSPSKIFSRMHRAR